MRRSCERPGCAAPVAVIYGYGSDGDRLHVWLDAWSAEREDHEVPEGSRGVVCERHGQLLNAPRGWDLLDHRDVVPRLFLPRPVLVHSRPDVESTTEGAAADTSAALRRRRIADLPMPQLFSELHSDDSVTAHVAIDDSVSVPSAVDSTSSTEKSRVDESDENLSRLLDASGPLLRQAFSRRNTGRHDPSKELMRPTTHQVVEESA